MNTFYEKDRTVVICEYIPPIYDMFDIVGIFLVIPLAPTLAENLNTSQIGGKYLKLLGFRIARVIM